MSERATLRRTLRNGAYVLLVVVAGGALYLGSRRFADRESDDGDGNRPPRFH